MVADPFPKVTKASWHVRVERPASRQARYASPQDIPATAGSGAMRSETQKPAAHRCGRASSKTIHFEQNTMVDRTGQADFEVFIHRLCQDEGTSIRKESRRPFA
jgi:hypothetical protein